MSVNISDRQKQSFAQDGFLITEQLIDETTIAVLTDRYARLFDGEFETGVCPDEVNWQSNRSDPTLTRQICNGWKADRQIARVVLSQELGRAIAQLAGWEGARLIQDNVIWKPPGARALGFHQDNAYVAWYTPREMLSCWIALDDTSADSGTLEVVRGSHRWPTCNEPIGAFHAPDDYRASMQHVARRLKTEPDVVPVAVPRGGGVFHHGWTWHGSGPNLSQRDRRALVLHGGSAKSRFVVENLNQGNGPIYGRYRRLGDDQMDEQHFPVLWTHTGYRTPGIEAYLYDTPAHDTSNFNS